MLNAQLHGVLRHLGSLRDTQALTEAPDAQLLKWFAREHEEAPFAALVHRHGPMVWSVSRRVLPHVHDAEDVFQATFLLLARKAASIQKGASVGSWLHGVAHRLALKARLQQARRQSREKRAADMRKNKPVDQTSLSEVQAALDTALGELPEKYRAALVLCYLEGMTQEEAARRLGCPLATVRTRVARGRKLLRERLTKHGLTLSTAGLATLLIASAAPAAAPTALVKAAVQAALPFAAGQSAAALCSKQAAGLVEGGLRTMFLTKVKSATGLLLAVCLIGGAVALTQPVTATDGAAKPPAPTADGAAKPPAATGAQPPVAQAKPPAVHDKNVVAYGGRVHGPDGRPVAGAKLYLTRETSYHFWPSPSPAYATTGPDGRFQFSVPQAKYHERATVVAATAANHGPGWVKVPPGGKRDELTLRLVPDDVPITGQIVDLEGKPLPGATLRVLQINAAHGEDLGPWLEAAQGKKGLSHKLEEQYLSRLTVALSAKDTTDAEGRFRLTGIGRNRLVRVQLDGPAIASQHLCILTRPGKAIEVTTIKGRSEAGETPTITIYYGASFRHVAAPSRPIVGLVRDQDTKKPLAGITLRSYHRANSSYLESLDYEPFGGVLQTTTDAQGRYRLTGLPKGLGNKIMVVPPGDLPYVAVHVEVPDSPGLVPVTVDVALKRGVWIEGKITDKVTGKPVQGAVEYCSITSNPNLRDYPGFDGPNFRSVAVSADGSYRVAGLPGPGLIAVYPPTNNYLQVTQREDDHGKKALSVDAFAYRRLHRSNCGAVARIDPAQGVGSVKRDVTLDPGWKFTGTVRGPDGKPLAGTRSFGLTGHGWDREALKSAEFTVWFNPHWPRDVFFQHPEKGLVGVARPPKDNGGTVTVQLAPGATVTGRLLDADGKPRVGVEWQVSFRPKGDKHWYDYSPERIKTDQEGRFRIDALVPGYQVRLTAPDGGAIQFGDTLRSGETMDLGDLSFKRPEK